MDIATVAPSAVGSHPAVRRVELVGSRARGDATRWSDWDYHVETDDFDAVAEALPQLVQPLEPLGSLWDRLADRQTFMVIAPGPVKVDFLFQEVPHEIEPPYIVRADNLVAIDVHMWDWSLWLTSKIAKSNCELLRVELEKMYDYLLRPMGISGRPRSLLEAVDAYLSARTSAEARFGVTVPRELGVEVERVVREVA